MNTDRHTCHAHGCSVHVPPELLMCRSHWRLVPKDLKRAVLRYYRPGQEIQKNPSDAYLIAAANAINAVAEIEQDRQRRYA